MKSLSRLKRIIALIMIVMLLFAYLPVYSALASPILTISPKYLSSSELPKSVTVTSSQSNTFTVGSIYPVLLPILGVGFYGESQALSLMDSSDTEVLVLIPSGLTDGQYELRIGDPNGDKTEDGSIYYLAGTVIIADGTIEGNVPIVSLANGYDTKENVTITGKYSNFSVGQSVVEIIDGLGSVVETPNVTDVTDVDDYTKTLTFSLNTGLISGLYNIKVTSGTELLTKTNGIEVRGAPFINLPVELSLSEGYSQNTISVTGSNTVFNNGTTVSVLDSIGDDTEKVGDITIINANSLTFTLNSGLSTGTYTVKVKTGVEESTANFVILQPSVDLKKKLEDIDVYSVGYANDMMDLRLIGTNTNFDNGTTQLIILNSLGQDVTASALSGSKTISGQTINFAINRNISAGTYTVKAVTGGEAVLDTFEIVSSSIQTIVFNSNVYDNSSSKLGKGYVGFSVSVVGTNTNFNSNTTAYIDGQDKVTSITSSDESSLNFNIESGLSNGSYVIVIDMDGDTGTTNDQLTSSTHGQLAFIVTEASINSVSPSLIVNTSDVAATINVNGLDTHFTVDDAIKVRITNSNGDSVGTVSNINISDDENLSFNVVPSSISSQGLYDVEVEVNKNGFVEISRKTGVLNVGTSGISDVSPGYVYEDQLNGGVYITLTGIGTSFNGTTQLFINDQAVTPTINSETSLAYTVPNSLTEGSIEIKVIESGKNPYITSFLVKKSRTISINPSAKELDYNAFDLFIDSNGTIDFNGSSNKPTITITGPNGFNQVINEANITIASNDIIYFSFPTDGEVGNYTLTTNWTSGDHSDLSLQASFIINHKYNEIYFKSDGAKVTSITKLEGDGSFNLTAWGKTIAEGQSDVDLTSKVIWNVASGNDVITIINGNATILKLGTATIEASYDGITQAIIVIINGEGGGGFIGFPPIGGIPVDGEIPEDGEETEGQDQLNGDLNDAEEQINNLLDSEFSFDETKETLSNIVQNIDELSRSLAQSLTSVIEKFGKVDVFSTINEDDGEVIQLDQVEFNNAIERVKDLKQNINELVEGIKENTLASLLNEPSITIPIEHSLEKKLTLPIDESLINTLNKEKLSLKLETDVTSLKIPSLAFYEDVYQGLDNISVNQVKIDIDNFKEIKEATNKSSETTENNYSKLIGDIYDFSISKTNVAGETTEIGMFNKPILLTLKVDSGNYSNNDVDFDKLSIFRFDEEKSEWVPEGGRYDPKIKSISVYRNHLSKYAVFEYHKTFDDIQSGWSWAKKEIEALASKVIIKGADENNFNPAGKITRAQFATLLGRALQLEEEAYDSNVFTDLKDNQYYTGYVLAMKKLGLITGYNDGTFRAQDEISREQMATMIMRTYEYVTGTKVTDVDGFNNTYFTDSNKISSWASNYVKAAKALGIINGVGNNLFAPKDIANRAQAAKMIYQMLTNSDIL